jgi:elongation factor Tu
MPSGGLQPGQVIAAAGTIRPRRQFTALLSLFTIAEGGLPESRLASYRACLQIHSAQLNATIEAGQPGRLAAGEIVPVSVRLSQPLIVYPRLRFTLLGAAGTVGAGLAVGA